MWGRKDRKLTAAQRLSLFVQGAAVEFEDEKEELETIQITMRGLSAYVSDCESRARQRGSAAAPAFGVIGQAMQAMSAGTDRTIAKLPPASVACLNAARVVLGIEDAEELPVAGET